MERPFFALLSYLALLALAPGVSSARAATSPAPRLDPFERPASTQRPGAVSRPRAAPRTTPQRTTAPQRPSASATGRAFRVVIDPGHGGHDEGTVYDNGRVRITEKDVTLRLALASAKTLRADGIDVILTRETDRDVALPRRTALANELQADIFISLHLNSTPTPMVSASPQGIETYILNNTTDATSRRIAQLENAGINPVVGIEPGGSPEQMDVAMILKDLRLDANLAESKRLACAVQGALVTATRPERSQAPSLSSSRNRGVKQALFHVLLGADMPSILVEAGFLSHPRDRAIVLSTEGQTEIGRALAQAVARYRGVRLPSAPPQQLAQLSSCRVN